MPPASSLLWWCPTTSWAHPTASAPHGSTPSAVWIPAISWLRPGGSEAGVGGRSWFGGRFFALSFLRFWGWVGLNFTLDGQVHEVPQLPRCFMIFIRHVSQNWGTQNTIGFPVDRQELEGFWPWLTKMVVPQNSFFDTINIYQPEFTLIYTRTDRIDRVPPWIASLLMGQNPGT